MNRNYIAIGVIIILVAAGLWFSRAEASGNNNSDTTINFNEITEVTQVTSITNGVSDKELAEGIAAAIVASGHQFDYGTHAWQGSIVGAYETGEDESAVSFGLGKHFEDMDALLHTSYTQSDDNHYFLFGGTFRF